jgi:tetratricopeptide (TPR) repeat protein
MKYFLVSLLSFLLSCSTALSQDVAAMIREADKLEAVPNEKGAFAKFKEVLKLQPSNLYALSKCSELCSRIGQRQIGNNKLRDEYYQAAKIYAETALRLNPNYSYANSSMAIALGRSSMSKSGKEKIANAREVKKYVDLALKNDPQNFKAWHVLGRWNYEIVNLSMLERAAVKVLYGGLPSASITESINAFEKARSISPGFVLNYFEMAKAYKEDDNKAKAIAYLNHMLTLPDATEDDASIKEKGRALLRQWE